MANKEFEVQIKERRNPSEEYEQPILLRKAIAEIEAEVAAQDSEDDSSSYDSDSDEEEDDDANLLTPAVDSQIFKTIAAIQAKDPRVYENSTDFFKDVDVTKSEKKDKKVKEPIVKLKDYERDILLEHGGFVNEWDESVKTRTHRQEQEDLRNAFKDVAGSEDDEEEDGFLTKKDKTSAEKEAEESDYRKFLLEHMKDDAPSKKAFEEWSNYKQNPKVNPEEAFLMEYVLNRGWVDGKGEKVKTMEEVDVEKDEEYLDNVDCFESKYNFRFEEEGASTIKTYSRVVEGTVRQTKSKRAKRRENEKAHKAALKEKKVEELKQQKNLKMKEIHDRLKEIREITGNNAVGLENLDFEGDFDPSIFDAQMGHVFNDGYYDGQEGDVNEKPVWDEDIETGLPDEGDIMDADYLPGGDKYQGQAITNTPAATEEAESNKIKFKDLMDEYYALNYEDVIGGDIYTRFKYAKTDPQDYGLTAEEILLADDAELNKYIGMKSLAPYRSDRKRARDDSVFEKNQKKKKKELTKHVESVAKKIEKEERKSAKREAKLSSKKHKKSKKEDKEESTKKHKKSVT